MSRTDFGFGIVQRLAFVNESMFYGHGILEGKQCHVVEFYYLMKPKGNRLVENGNSNGETQGMPEYLRWIPIEEFAEHKAFPEFFSEKLCKMPESIEHYISDER